MILVIIIWLVIEMENSVVKLLKENEELVKELITLKHLCRNLKNKYFVYFIILKWLLMIVNYYVGLN